MKGNVIAYTDGACAGNPGPGGWSVVFVYGGKYIMLSGHELDTTNNRMELLAVIKCIQKFKNVNILCDRITIFSDSAYVVNAIKNNWIAIWKMNGWISSKKEKVKNKDLWEVLYRYIIDFGDKIEFVKVKGHNGNLLNELADKRAKEEVIKAKIKKEG